MDFFFSLFFYVMNTVFCLYLCGFGATSGYAELAAYFFFFLTSREHIAYFLVLLDSFSFENKVFFSLLSFSEVALILGRPSCFFFLLKTSFSVFVDPTFFGSFSFCVIVLLYSASQRSNLFPTFSPLQCSKMKKLF